MSDDCLFCKIAQRKLASTVVYETAGVLGFKDVHPQAPVHILFIPKQHISGVHEITAHPAGILESLVSAANQVAREFKIAGTGYRLVINCKKDAGQTIDHLHLHLLGGRPMAWPPG